MATNNTDPLRRDDARSEEILARIPSGRWGEPARGSTLDRAVVLAAPRSSFARVRKQRRRTGVSVNGRNARSSRGQRFKEIGPCAVNATKR
jgi:hypothetical protein